MGRVLRTMSGARFRYFNSNAGLCSEKLASLCGRPASSSATFRPVSARRLHAQPPDAPEPTTRTSKTDLLFEGIGSSGMMKANPNKREQAGQRKRMIRRQKRDCG